MNKKNFGFFICALIFLSACVQQITPQYLELPSDIVDYIITTQETFTLKYFVINPNPTTFIGEIEYDFDDDCLSAYGVSDFIHSEPIEIEITPQEQKKAVRQDFSYKNNWDNEDKCLQQRLRISVSVKDKGGDIKDSFDLFLTIVN